jgi:hypothetical protein
MRYWQLLVFGLLLLAACRPAPAGSERGAAPTAPAVGAPAAPTSAAAGAAAQAASAAPAAPAALETVRVGTVGSATDVVFSWAQERGYLREEASTSTCRSSTAPSS